MEQLEGRFGCALWAHPVVAPANGDCSGQIWWGVLAKARTATSLGLRGDNENDKGSGGPSFTKVPSYLPTYLPTYLGVYTVPA
jgi:hypothetical protein